MELQNSHLYTSFLFGLLLPFSTALSNVALIGFYVSVALLILIKKTTFQKNNIRLLKYSTLALFLICLLSVLFTKDYGVTFNMMGRRVTYLLTPLVCLFLSNESLYDVKKIALKGLFVGSLLSAVFLLSKNFIFYFATRPFLGFDNELFSFYHTGFQFAETVGIHPSYLGAYYLFGLGFLIFYNHIKRNVFKIVGCIVLISAIVFLASRAVYIILIFMLFIALWVKLKNTFQSKLTAQIVYFFGVLMLSLTAVMLFKNTYLYDRVTKEAAWELTHNVNENFNANTKSDSRAARWDVAMQLFLEKPFFGYGAGNEKKLLTEAYLESGLTYAAQKKYDTHNQFLSYMLEFGVFGLLLFVCFLAFNLKHALKTKEILFSLFIVSITLIGFVENFFNNNAGITFIAFFGTVFLFSNAYLSNKK